MSAFAVCCGSCTDPSPEGEISGKALRAIAEEDLPSEDAGSRAASAVISADGAADENQLCQSDTLNVDLEVLRTISLRQSLRNMGWYWRQQPAQMSSEQLQEVWQRTRAANQYDLFLSHTWHTPGYLKFWSLLLVSYWWTALLGCCSGLLLAIVLYVADLLPLPLMYVAQFKHFGAACPMAPFALIFTSAFGFLALLLSPYLPGSKDDIFYDFACINQADEELRKRGTYGIGGWLAVTRELRVLWSPLYLTRVWCVFELAAYRIANPAGRITFQPIFVENIVLRSFGGVVFCTVALHLGLQSRALRAMPFLTIAVGPALVAHITRGYMRDKHCVGKQFAEFDLANVECGNSFDRDFIHGAIRRWYGSEEKFTAFVRGALREEVVQKSSTTQAPWVYHLLVMAPYLAGYFDVTWALWKGGAPPSCVLAFLIGQSIPSYICAVLFLEAFYLLCDRFAAKWHSKCAEWATNLSISLFVGVMFQAQSLVSRLAYGGAPLPTASFDGTADAWVCGPELWTSTAVLLAVLLLALLFTLFHARRSWKR